MPCRPTRRSAEFLVSASIAYTACTAGFSSRARPLVKLSFISPTKLSIARPEAWVMAAAASGPESPAACSEGSAASMFASASLTRTAPTSILFIASRRDIKLLTPSSVASTSPI